MPSNKRTKAPETNNLPVGATLNAAPKATTETNTSNTVFSKLLKHILDVQHAYVATLKKVGPSAFFVGLGVSAATLSAVMLAPQLASLATAFTGLLQTTGILGLTQFGLSCIANLLSQAANLTALLGSSLLGLCSTTSNLGVAAAQALGTSIVALLSALSAALLTPALVSSAKFLGNEAKDGCVTVKNSVSSLVGNLHSKLWSLTHKAKTAAAESAAQAQADAAPAEATTTAAKATA